MNPTTPMFRRAMAQILNQYAKFIKAPKGERIHMKRVAEKLSEGDLDLLDDEIVQLNDIVSKKHSVKRGPKPDPNLGEKTGGYLKSPPGGHPMFKSRAKKQRSPLTERERTPSQNDINKLIDEEAGTDYAIQDIMSENPDDLTSIKKFQDHLEYLRRKRQRMERLLDNNFQGDDYSDFFG